MGSLKDNDLIYKPSGGMFVKPAEIEESGRLIDLVGAKQDYDVQFGEKVVFSFFYSDDEEQEPFRFSLGANDYRRQFIAHFEAGRDVIENVRLHKMGKVWVLEDAE